MSKLIEEQIVKMQFDNKGFESGVQESMSTLDKLKAALHFKDVNLTPLEKAFSQAEATATRAGFHIQDVWLKVSEVFEYQIARKIMNAGENLVKSLSVDNITDGWSKYEQKTGNVQTLLNSTGKTIDEVNGYLEELMWYSDETSFGFTDMTSALSTMVSAGGDIDKLIPMIEGMGNATAYAGKGAAEFSRVIYNLNQSYSQGFLSTMDWRSVEMAGASSKQLKQYLMEAAEEVGTIKKGTSDIANWSTYLSKKLITSEAMEIAFKRFAEYTEAVKEAVNSGKYETATEAMEAMATDGFDAVSVAAFNAAQNYKSFSEAVDATKDAVSSGWLSTFELIFGNFEEAKELWTTIGNGFWEIFASGAEHRNNVIAELMNDPLDTFEDKLQHCGVSLEDFESAFRSVAKDNGIAIDSLIEKYGGFDKFIRSGNVTSKNLIKETLSALADKQKINTKVTNDALSSLEKYQEAINKVMTDPALGTGAERIKQLTEAGYDAVGTQKLINHLYEKNGKNYKNMSVSASDLVEVLGELNETELESIGLNETQVANLKELAETADQTGESLGDLLERINKPSGRELFFESLSNVMDILIDTINIVKVSFRNVFPEVAVQSWYNAIETVTIGTRKIKAFLENEENIDKLSKTLGGLFSILKLIGMVTKGTITIGFKVLKAVLEEFDMDILSLTANIGNAITTFVKWIEQQEIAKKIAKGISNIIKGLISVIKKAGTTISKTSSTIVKDLKDFWNEFVKLPIIKEIVSDFTNALDRIRDSFSNIRISLTGADGEASKFFSKFKDKETLDKLNTVLTKVYNKLKDFKNILVNVKNNFVNFFNELKRGKTFSEAFKDSFGGVVEAFDKIKTAITDFFDKIFGGEGNTKDKFNELSTAIHDFFKNLDGDKVTAIALTTVFGLFAINLLRLTNAVSDTVAAIGGTFNTLKSVINSYFKKQKSILLQIAESIVIVAAALYVLSTIPADDMKKALTALYAISGCIAVLMIVMTAVTKIGNSGLPEGAKITRLSESISSLLALAGTIVLAALAIKKISEIELGEGILKKLGLVLGAMTGLAGIAMLLSKFGVSKGPISSTAITLVAVAGAMLIVAVAMEKIGSVAKDPESLDVITKSMLKMMAGLAVVALAAGSIGGFSALGILAVVVLFEKLMPRIESIINYDYTAINKGLEQNKAVIEKIGLMMGAMVVVGGLFGKGFSKMGSGLIKLVAVIGLLTVVASFAGKLKYVEITKGIKFIDALTKMITKMVIALGVYNLMSKLDKGQKGGVKFGAFLGIVLTLGAMALIAKAAGKLDAEEMKKGLTFISVLTILIDAMFVTAGIAGKGNGSSFKNLALILAGVSFILGLLVTLSLIKDKKSLYTSVAAVAVVIGSLSILFRAVSKITSESNKTGKMFKKSGANSGPIFAVIAGVAAIIGGMIWLSKQPFKNIVASAGAIVVTLLAVTKVFEAIRKSSDEAKGISGKQISAIIGSLLCVAVVASVIGVLANKGGDAKKMAAAAGGITVGLLGLSVCIKALSKVSESTDRGMNYKRMWANIGGAISVLIAATAAIWALSTFGGDPKSIITSAGAITLSLIGVSICIASVALASRVAKENNVAASKGVLIGAISAIAAVAIAIGLLSNFGGDGQKMIDSAIAIGIASVAVGVAALLMGTAAKIAGKSDWKGAAASIGGAIAALAAVALAVGLLANNITTEQAQNVADLAVPMSILLGAVGVLAICMAATARILGDANPAAALGPIAIALLVIAALGAAAWGIGEAMAKWEGLDEKITKGLDMLVVIFSKVGEAIGKLIGEFLAAVNDSVIVGLGKSLNTFMDDDHAGGFFKKVAEVPEEAIKGALNIAAIIAAFIGVSWLDFITNILSLGKNGLQSIDMASIGKMVTDFSHSVKDIESGDLVKAKMASGIALALSEFVENMPREDGWWQRIVGTKKDVGTFGEEMTGLITGIKTFTLVAATLTEEDIAAVNTAIAAAEILRDFASTLENTGGLLAEIMGDDDLKTFGNTLTPFMVNLMKTVDKAIELNAKGDVPAIIQKVIDAAEPLNTFAQQLDNTGGLLAEIVGDNDLKTFGDTLVPFVTNLADFVDVSQERLKGNTVYWINKVCDSATPLSSLASTLSLQKRNFLGIGQMDLGKFIKQIKKFAEGLVEICSNRGSEDIDASVMENISSAAEPLMKLSSNGEGVIPENIRNIVDAFNSLSRLDVKKVSEAISSDISIGEAIDKLINSMSMTLIDSQEETNTKFSLFAKTAIADMKLSIIEHTSLVLVPAITSMVNTVKNRLTSMMSTNAFTVYGKNVAVGLANGISNASYLAVAASVALGDSVAEALQKALDEHSPSKLSSKMGLFWDKGLANGISDNTGVVVTSVEGMADEVISATNSVISAISSVLDSDLDLNPTIRPVVDASDIYEKSEMINDMLSYDTRKFSPSTSLSLANSVSSRFNRVHSMEYAGTGMTNGITDNSAIGSAVRDALGYYIPDIIKAINNSSEDRHLSVDLTPNTKKWYKEIRIENQNFERTNGFNGLI